MPLQVDLILTSQVGNDESSQILTVLHLLLLQLSRGFCNWKDGTIAFRQHEKSLFHKLAVEKLLTLPATTRNVGEMLSTALVQERENNRHCLLKVLSSLKFLARQGCGIRGHDECEGNLYQLMKLMSKDDSKVYIIDNTYKPLSQSYTTYIFQIVSGMAEEEK